ncbi:MAG: glycosyltransferase family 2 protein, partial [Phycisphaerales bacterium]
GAGPARVARLCDPAASLAALNAAVTDARAPRVAATTVAPRPLVSVVIPYYNMGAYLPQTLASARAQTYRNIEIVLVDDGSTDAASVALLATLGSDVRIVRKPNGGLSSARNAGITAARGDWVVPLDADDLLMPTAVERLVRAVERDPGLTFVSPLVSYFRDDPEAQGQGDGARERADAKRETKAGGWCPLGAGWCPLGADRDLLAVRNVGAAASGTLIRRARALEVGGYDERLTSYEDWDFWCTLAERGDRGTVVPEFLLRYRVRADSMFRTEALERDAALRAYLLRKHPRLAARPDRVTRMLLSASIGAAGVPSQHASASSEHASAAARALIAENLRYRLADRVNSALKRAGVQRAIKELAEVLRRRDDR